MRIAQINQFQAEYPEYLKAAEDHPANIYVLGKLPKEPMLAIVGTRTFTSYGEHVAYQLASELARAGIVIVSGLAYGIDSIAHRAALDAGGKTVAVLAGGLHKIYPSKHRGLAMEILAKGGALVSEWPEGTESLPPYFARRNRIITGLSKGVIVVESKAKGGAMLTANFASKQGRTIMAVPGKITDENSAGCNNLIRAGAKAITDSTDVLQELNIPTSAIPASVIKAQNPHEARILEELKKGEGTNEFLLEATGLNAPAFASVISLMEITGKVRNLGAGRWAHR
jgi:DNA processing protein